MTRSDKISASASANRLLALAAAVALLGCEAQPDSSSPPPAPGGDAALSPQGEVAKLFPSTPSGSGEVRNVNDKTFEEEVTRSKGVVLVDFWAPWCGPCRQLAPTIEAIARDGAGKVKVLKFNVDEGSVVPRRFGVRSIPTVFVFKDGSPVGSRVGLNPRRSYDELIQLASR